LSWSFFRSKSLKEIPCYIRELNDKEAKLLALTENLERADLTSMEEARAYANYLNYTPLSKIDNADFSIMQRQKKGNLVARIKELAIQIPPEYDTIKRRLKLLDLPNKIQIMVDREDITMIEAETLISLKEIVDIKIKSLPDGLSNNEKIEEYQKAWKDCHQVMWSIAENMPKKQPDPEKPEIKYSDIPTLKRIIKQRITEFTRETSAQAEQQAIFQERFDLAKDNLIVSLIDIEENEILQDILEYDFNEEFGDLLDIEKETTKDEWNLLKKKSKELLGKYEKKQHIALLWFCLWRFARIHHFPQSFLL